MTYNPNAPNASQSPGLFPTQANTNFGRLKTLIQGDHQFNDSVQTTDGKHLQVTLINRAVPSSLPAGTIGMVYARTISGVRNLYWYDGTVVEQLTNTALVNPVPVLAAVNFDGTTAANPMTMRSNYNITSVQRTSTGNFTINFTTPIPNNRFVVQVTGMRDSDSSCVCFVRGDATYGNSMATTFVRVSFRGDSFNQQNPFMGSVIVYGMP
jgi:hypothetical protein